jgi:hypothetical protein
MRQIVPRAQYDLGCSVGPSVTVTCGGCGDTFELSLRREYAHASRARNLDVFSADDLPDR